MTKAEMLELSQYDTKERIFRAATHLFAHKGYGNTSTKDICELADVNISAVNYHFRTKELLYREILQSFYREGRAIFDNLLRPCKDIGELKVRLRIFVDEFVDKCLANSESALLLLREVELLREETKDLFQEIMNDRVLESFFESAREAKLIRDDVDIVLLSDFLTGHIFNSLRFSRFSRKYKGVDIYDEQYRRKWGDQLVSLVFNGIVAD